MSIKKTIKNMMDEIVDEVCDDEDDEVVTKSVPATKEEVAEQKAMLDEASKLHEKLKAIKVRREKWWAKVQVRLDTFGKHLTYNEETKEIEFRESRSK